MAPSTTRPRVCQPGEVGVKLLQRLTSMKNWLDEILGRTSRPRSAERRGLRGGCVRSFAAHVPERRKVSMSLVYIHVNTKKAKQRTIHKLGILTDLDERTKSDSM